MSRIHIGHIPPWVNENDLKEELNDVRLSDLTLITDRHTGRSRCFATAVVTAENAPAVVAALNGSTHFGRTFVAGIIT